MRFGAMLMLACLVPAQAAASDLDDPLPVRDQFPFRLLFLDQTPYGAELQGKRQVRLSVNAAYVNTMVATDDLIQLFEQNGQQAYDGKVTLNVLQLVAAAQSSRTAFVLDAESLRTAVQARVGLSRRLEVALEVPFLSQGRGFMDSFIDSFHRRFDLPDGGRTGFSHNQFRAGYIGDGEIVYLDDSSHQGIRLGDTVVSMTNALLLPRGRVPALSATVSVKAPTGDYRNLDGSGSFDYGLTLRLSRQWGRSNVHVGYSWSDVGDWKLAPSLPLNNPRSLLASYVFSVTQDTSLVLQALRTSGPFPFRSGNDLGKVAMGVTGGFRHRLPRGFQVEWSFVENLEPFYNAIDIGSYLGFTYSTPSTSERAHGALNGHPAKP